MIRLKTKTTKTVPSGRGTADVIMHVIVDQWHLNEANVTSKGYYYYYDDNNEIVKLSDIHTITPLALFEEVETNLLPELPKTKNIMKSTLLRVKQTTLMNIAQEEGESYGILPEDLIDSED